MNRVEQLVADLEYLEAAGLTVNQLRTLHHWSDRPEAAQRVTFSSARNYFKKGQELGTNNAAFSDRLRFIAELHQQGLAGLVKQARIRFPI